MGHDKGLPKENDYNLTYLSIASKMRAIKTVS